MRYNRIRVDLGDLVPRFALAERHRAFLLHWDQAGLATRMRMLHQAGIGPWTQMRDDAP